MKKIIPFLATSFILAGCSPYVDGQPGVMKTSGDFKEDVSVCYEIFPIAYRDSDGDGSGDLNGITDSLDYLEELGVDCLWLTPIQTSDTYHKYDTKNYELIDPLFGSQSDYERLLREAEERGIYVLMDFVINHTSTAHPWFISWLNGEAAYADYYSSISQEEYESLKNKDGWHLANDRYYFGSFWSEMPELNFENQLVREELYRIAKYWMDLGVDGFRIDAAKHVYDPNEYLLYNTLQTTEKNIDFFKEFNETLKKEDKDVFILGEVWQRPSVAAPYLAGMDSLFNFGFGEAIIDALNKESAEGLARNITTQYEAFFDVREDALVSNFLTNHDQMRSYTMMNDNMNRSRQAAVMLFTHPGISWIYYGEEIGMSGRKPDEDIREPFLWGTDSVYNSRWKPLTQNQETIPLSDQMNEGDSLYSLYKDLIEMRQSDETFKNGTYQSIETGHSKLYAYRLEGNSNYLIIHNVSSQTVSVEVSYKEVLFSLNVDVSDDLVLHGNGSVVLKVSENTDNILVK